MTDQNGLFPAKPRRLPIAIVVKRSFLYAWESRAVLAVPTFIYVAATILGDLLLAWLSDNRVVEFAVWGLLQTIAMSFAVGIHRFCLLGEAPHGARFFRRDRNFVHYALTALALILSAGVVFVLAMGMLGNAVALGAEPGKQSIVTLIGLVIIVSFAILFCRVLLILPAAAIGDHNPLKTIWQRTRFNGPRLLGADFLAFLPFLAAQLIVMLSVYSPAQVFSGASGVTPNIALTAIQIIIAPLQLIVLNIALSLQYDILVRGNGPAA
jgi:hypothetical protein